MSDVPKLGTINEVARELGLSAPTLRSWERRYGIGPSARTLGGHRRYGPEDVARLKRLVELSRSQRISTAVMTLAQEA